MDFLSFLMFMGFLSFLMFMGFLFMKNLPQYTRLSPTLAIWYGVVRCTS